MNEKNTVHYYESFDKDFVESKNQNYILKKNYKWIHNNIFYRAFAKIIYFIAKHIAFRYCNIVLREKVVNRSVLKPYKNKGIFIYGNHTQLFGDVIIPAYVCKDKHIYTVISPANLGIPVIGKALPMLGGLPIPNSRNGMKAFVEAINQRIKEKSAVIIYPEAHVWPYCTFIRPFPVTSFRYPVALDTPSFAMTTTYQRRKHSKKPKAVTYIKGPFFPDKSLPAKMRQEKLRDEIKKAMELSAENSTYEYIRYTKK